MSSKISHSLVLGSDSANSSALPRARCDEHKPGTGARQRIRAWRGQCLSAMVSPLGGVAARPAQGAVRLNARKTSVLTQSHSWEASDFVDKPELIL